MNKQFKVVMRIGDDYVADNRNWSIAQAKDEQQRILLSPSFKCEPAGTIGVRVMHWRTFRGLCEKSRGCTLRRLENNIKRFGRDAVMKSPLAVRVEQLKHLFVEDKNHE